MICMSANSIDEVYELFLQVERECEFDKGYTQGINEGKEETKKEIALKMLEESLDDETIRQCTGFSTRQLHEFNGKTSVSGFIH